MTKATLKSKLSVKKLSKAFATNKVLDAIDLEVYDKESLVILGGSGSGKSVLIKTIVGLISPDSGSIYYNGVDVTNISNHHSGGDLMSRFGFLFQGGALFDSLRVWENITFYLLHNKYISVNDAKEIAEKKLQAVGLTAESLYKYPSELSGGMQKRVALARAIANDPEVIFFDEPTTGLDPIMSNVINDLICQVRESLNTTTITITHDINSAKSIATRVAMLYKGKIVWVGNVEQMYKSNNEMFDQLINGRVDGPIKIGAR